jgi:pilus assembly protein Flp/PilA
MRSDEERGAQERASAGGRQMFDTIKMLAMALGRDKKGATAIEYGLIAALIAVVIIGVVTAVGNGLTGTFQSISSQLGGS